MRIRLDRKAYDRAIKKLLSSMTEKDDPFSKQMAGIVIDGMIKRTKKGVDIGGQTFKPYSKEYAKTKKSNRVDLTSSGKLISKAGFDFEVLGGDGRVYVRIFVPGGPHGFGVDFFTLASVHNFGMRSGRGAGFQMPKREYFGLDQKIIKELTECNIKHWKEILRRIS